MPPFPPQGPSGRFPCVIGSTAALRLPVARPAVASFPSFGGTAAAPWASSRSRPRRASCGPGVVHRNPQPDHDGDAGPPRFLGNPNVYMPCSSTPAGPLRSPLQHLGVAFRQCRRRRLPRSPNFEAQSHGRPLAVYASQAGSPHRHARLASGWLASLVRAGRDYPLGPKERFQLILPPFPGFAWRTLKVSRFENLI